VVVQFSADAWPGIAAGSITVTFRRWKRRQAKVGGRHRVGGLELEIDAVDQVSVGSLRSVDARSAGEPDRDALLDRLRRGAARRGEPLDDDELVWRVAFHVAGRDHRALLAEHDDLAPEELEALVARLDRLDRASHHGPWTTEVLALIGARPGTVSTELAAALGRDRPAFKQDVRKLKALGLTESLDVGYRLSARGRRVLDER
jgi:hypothetical protein